MLFGARRREGQNDAAHGITIVRDVVEIVAILAAGIRLQLHNIGTVKAHFLGMGVNVYGQRVIAGRPQVSSSRGLLKYDFSGYARTSSRVPVYGYAYLTHLGDPSTGQDTALDPGSTLENDRTFYVPQGRFDLLSLGFDAPYTKFDDATVPARLEVTPQGRRAW